MILWLRHGILVVRISPDHPFFVGARNTDNESEMPSGRIRSCAARRYRFSKDWEVHVAMSYFTAYRSNFCWPVRTLRTKAEDGRWQRRTPAMAAGLTDHAWTLEEWIKFPAIQCK
jgi:hypothetical protein